MSKPLAPEDQAFLQHYRAQDRELPSAAMDARILAAAQQALELRRPSLLARLGHWLAGASLAQRGSLALGSLASVGLALGLLWQTGPQYARTLQEDRLMVAPAPAPAMQAAPDSRARLERPAPPPAPPQLSAPAVLSAKPAVLPERAKSRAGQAPAELSAIDARSDALEAGLLEVLRLRAEGRSLQAQQRLQQLQQEFPGVALQQRLAELAESSKGRAHP